MVAASKRKAKTKKTESVTKIAITTTKSTTKTSADTASPIDPRAWASVDPPLSQWMLEALASMGFGNMTPVQASTIPLFMGNKDVVVEAVTGSGKTLAFLIPVVERLLRAPEPLKKNQVTAIIISPTRELAAQLNTVLCSILAFHGPSAIQLSPRDDNIAMPTPESISGPCVKPLLLLGGNTSPAQDLRNFLERSPNLLIGTPGRLNELLSSQHIHFSADSFETLILDEADRLLDLGFKETLTKIISRLPKQRRTGLFSASISDAVVGSLVRTGLRNPVKVVVKVRGENEEKRTPASLDMAYQLATPAQRLVYIQRILSPEGASIFPTVTLPQKTIVYFSNCAAVDYFTSLFPAILGANASTYSIVPLHGKMNASMRQRNFAKYVNSTAAAILLTTDLAARGLDIPEVDLVVQIDAPTDPKVFLHRCGRAGRAGRKGLAILFLSPGREEGYIDFLDIRKTPVMPLRLPDPLCDTPEHAEIMEMVSRMRGIVLKDRALHEKAMKAFVSHVRSHSKHQTAGIFRVADLEWKDLAESYALLKMPKMPELKKLTTGKVELGVDFDLTTLAYKDKIREKARQEELARPKVKLMRNPLTPEELDQKRRKYEAWSGKAEEQEEKSMRRERKRKRREIERLSKMAPEEKAKEDEWKELLEKAKKQRLEKEKLAEGEAEFFKGFD